MNALDKINSLGRNATTAEMPNFTFSEAARFHFFMRMIQLVEKIEGDIVECGVGWGRSLLHLLYLIQLEAKDRNVWAFDSFEGFPEPTAEDRSERNVKKGEWRSDIKLIQKMLSEAGLTEDFLKSKLIIIKGFFDESLKNYRGGKIALLHIDVDIYKSYVSVLNQLYDKIEKGGIIIFDEYINTNEIIKFPGAKKAIDDFFTGREEIIIRDKIYGKYFAVKK